VSAQGKRERGYVLALLGIGAAVSCMLVAPLEDPPELGPGASGGTGAESQGGQSGAGDTGNVGGSSGTGKGGSAGSAGADPTGCASNAECVELGAGEPYRCRPSDRECVALKTSECPLAYGDAQDPNAIFFGVFAPLSADRPDLNSLVWSHLLARDELSGDNVGGLPGGPSGSRRPLVMIVCNNDPSVVEESVRHLADDVQVPALLATLLPGDLRRAFETHRDRDIFFLSPIAATRILVDQDDDDLIWSMLGQPSDLAPAYNELLALVEDYVKSTRTEAATRHLKVVLVSSTDAFNDELRNYVEPALRFNGNLSAMTNRTNANYLSLTIEPDADLREVALEIAGFEPDIVISVAGEQFSQAAGIAETIELEWGLAVPGKERPYFILSPFNAGNLAPLHNLIEAMAWGDLGFDPLAYRRYVGVSVAGAEDKTLQNSYASRLLPRFEDALTDTGNYYDATYFLAYAMVGAGTAEPLTGPDIARGMRRLLEGQTFDVGPMDISDIFGALENAGTTIELQGTLGPPDFDGESGVRYAVGGVFCFEETGQMATLHVDVLRYNRMLGNFNGEFPCFSGFFQ
jgi:hypothetical protein